MAGKVLNPKRLLLVMPMECMSICNAVEISRCAAGSQCPLRTVRCAILLGPQSDSHGAALDETCRLDCSLAACQGLKVGKLDPMIEMTAPDSDVFACASVLLLRPLVRQARRIVAQTMSLV